MGKSLGNTISLKEIFHEGTKLLDKTFEPVVVRHFILTSHYRQPIDFSNEALKAAESGSHKLRDAARELSRAAAAALKGGTAVSAAESEPEAQARGQRSEPEAGARDPDSEPEAPARTTPASIAASAKSDAIRTALTDIGQRFTDAMNEDFNTAAAIAVAFDLAKQSGEWIHADLGKENLIAADALMRHLTGDALGFKWPAALGGADESKQDELIRLLADLREDARKQKNFALSDQIRDRLAALGVNLRDTPDGPTW
jgi:cysteinyl-tRNA synthetase